MLWEVETRPAAGEVDREAERVRHEAAALGSGTIRQVAAARSYLLEGKLDRAAVERAVHLLADGVVESTRAAELGSGAYGSGDTIELNVLFKPGVTDNVALTAKAALVDLGVPVTGVATCRRYWINGDAAPAEIDRLCARVLANDAIEHVVRGELALDNLAVGRGYEFELRRVTIRELDDAALLRLSREGQLYLSLAEMQTIRQRFLELGREPTDIELESIAQTWSEHCSHKTLAGRIRYRDEHGERQFDNMLKETVFAATRTIRERLGDDDWCVSVFRDNAGVVRFNDEYDVCIKVETHNHPSAIEPYGGANTGLGGVIRDPLGTGLGAKPVCNTDVFCFAPPDTSYDDLPPGVLHPRTVLRGVVAGVRDYGNRMGIPTVNGAVYFDPRYIGNPLVFCGNVALIPRGKSEKKVHPGDHIVAVGGRTGRDGIHGATFSSAELTHESEAISGGSVQIGNAITEKMMMDVILTARDRGLYHAITDCGAGGFSSAVGEMGEESGAEVWLDRAPLKYAGLSYTEIWISEAQERMVLAVPPQHWDEFHALCAAEGVEATIIGRFTETGRLVLQYEGREVGNLSMEFLHGGRPPVVREAEWKRVERRESRDEREKLAANSLDTGHEAGDPGAVLKRILGSLNVCSKEWIIRQYDHEVQAGSVVKPLVGVRHDGPSDAAVVRPDLKSPRGLVVACGMNPRYGDFDPYRMAVSAIDEAVRNCVAVGADPARIAILDNFCWGNTERPETLGSLVRAALGCHDAAVAYGTPFVSGKDSLNNEFTWEGTGDRGQGSGPQTIGIPPSLLITALGQMEDVAQAVTMDLKETGNSLFLVGAVTGGSLPGTHFELVTGRALSESQGAPPLDLVEPPRVFAALHRAIRAGLVRSCHDVSEGGLAITIAEMAFAGEVGAAITLDPRLGEDAELALFGESDTRFLCEVAPESVGEFQRLTGGVVIGATTESRRVVIAAADRCVVIDESLDDLKRAWQQTLRMD